MNFRKWTLGASFKGTVSKGDRELWDEDLPESIFTGIFGS